MGYLLLGELGALLGSFRIGSSVEVLAFL